VTLPEKAAEFDQVRGGRAFCVVYKRGGASFCLVTRDGSRAEASLVALEGPVADVAVTEASVVVAFAGGKLALYDLASLAAPGEGPKEPMSTVPAGGKGRPRVLLATTTKGATSIWVGTAEGEVMRAALVEVAAAPEPPAAEPAAPVAQAASSEELEALRKEVASLREALDARALELASAKGELDARAVELASVKGELDARAVELASARGELGIVKRDLAKTQEDLREERARFEHSLGKRIDGVLPERVRGGVDFVVSLVENRRRG
jgi:hypothetical protein